MASDDLEGTEIESLIHELRSVPRQGAQPKPAAGRSAPPRSERSSDVVEIHVPEPKPRNPFLSQMNLPPLPSVNLSRAVTIPRARPRLWSWPAAWSLPALSPSEATAVRMWVALGVILSVAMPYWPYPKASSWWLFLYLSAVAMVLVTGVRSAMLTWTARLAYSHTVALGIVLWGLVLAAAVVLPRVGYAREAAVWW